MLTPKLRHQMKKKDNSEIKEEVRELRKKAKRIEESRSLIKAKNRKKGEIIKTYQDRQGELEQSRDSWKAKYKAQEKDCAEMEKQYKKMAALFEMKEEQLKEILTEFQELKKKYPNILLS
jgi:chromosome segregation ATPase